MLKDTQKIKEKLIAEHGFSSDRELLKLLGIDKNTPEGHKKMLMIFGYIEYQNAFASNDGYERGMLDAEDTRDNEASFNKGVIEGREQMKQEFRELLKKDL